MQFKKYKLRFSRQLKAKRRGVESASKQASDDLEQYFFRRLGSLRNAGRFVAGWILLFMLLIGITVSQLKALDNTYEKLEPVPGGIYSEGVLGTFTNANPLYATGEVNSTVSRLLFAGLLKYNDNNQLVGDLAESWSANNDGTVYTVRLRPHLVWQDGAPLTADDVVFTYQTIQNPNAQSPLASSWQGIKVTKQDDRTVVFTLPDPLSSFPYNLTNGIIPKHLLQNVPPANLRSVNFDTKHPIGSGPFEWQAIQVSGSTAGNAQTQIALLPFSHYYGGTPKLDSFVVYAFASQDQLISSFESGQLTAMDGLSAVPAGLENDNSVDIHNMNTSAASMVFFNNAEPPLNDPHVRQALVAGASASAVISQLNYPARAVHEPLLEGQLGYNPKYEQSRYDVAKAASILDHDGWRIKAGGLRYKKNQPLQFDLFASNTPDNQKVAKTLQSEWRQIGVDARTHMQNPDDLQNTLASYSYGAVLESIAIGVDPDVFVYWGSTGAGNSSGLNFSQYQSSTADLALEAGRTRLDPQLRVIKYQPFLAAWQKDAPALGLYQPRFLYITRGPVYGLNDHTVNSDTDRFDNVQNWMVNEARVTDN